MSAPPSPPTPPASAASNLRWAGASQVLRQAAILGSALVFANVLGPELTGVVVLATSLVSLGYLFTDLGTLSAVIQRRDPSPRLLATIHGINCAAGLVACAAFVALSGPLARGHDEPRLRPVLVALALGPLLIAAGSVHQAWLERSLRFRDLARIEVTSTVVGAMAGIGAALLGAGAMSVAAQQVLAALLSMLLLRRASALRLPRGGGWSEAREVLTFSGPIAAFSGLNYLHRNGDNLIIQKGLGTLALGWYGMAYKLMLQPLQPVWAVFARVAYPRLCRVSDDLPAFRSVYLRTTGAVAFVAFPVTFGIAVTAREIVEGLLSPGWEPAIPVLRILAVVAAVQSLGTLAGLVYQALGRTDLMLKVGVASTVLVLGSFVAGLPWGIVGVASSYAIANVVILVFGLAIPLRLAGMRLGDLAPVVWRPLSCSAITCAVVIVLRQVLPETWPPRLDLAVLVGAGVAAHALAAWTLDRESVRELRRLVAEGSSVR